MDINLSRLWKVNNNQYPLLGTSTQLSGLTFMAEYIQNHNELDRNLALTKGYMIPLWNMSDEETESAVVNQFRSDAAAVIKKHKVDLEKLWNATLLEYNPIGNFKVEEEGSESSTGSEDETKNFGAQSKTLNYGAQSESDAHGAKSSTENDAAYTDTDNIGAKSKSNENKVAPYDSNSYENDEKNDETEAARVDSTAYGAKSKTKSEQAYTDSKSKQAYTDSETIAAKAETSSIDKEGSKEHSLSKEGNIGTTSFQSLISSEIKLWKGFNFYNELFDLICKELCYFADNGDAPILTPIQNKLFK